MIKRYYQLTKPGMIYGNALTTTAGFLLASRGNIDFWLLFATLAGLSLIIASGCVFNNYIDRDIDERMERTRERALVKGLIPISNAILFGICLGLAGALILGLYTNALTLCIAFFGFFAYVVLYSLWTKRRSVHSTMVGSLAGAVPPVVGYCAVIGRIDTGAILLFIILCVWQMAHFFSIAIYRLDDYTAASIPLLPVKKGIPVSKIHTLLYVIVFIIAISMLTVFGYTGYVYLSSMILLGCVWLGIAIKGFWTIDNKKWARQMFIFSLVIIFSFCVAIAFDVAR